MLERFKELSDLLSGTASRLEKEAILARYKEDDDMREILHFLFNPYIVTGISDKKLSRAIPPMLESVAGSAGSLIELIEYFKKNSTGRDVDVSYLRNTANALG